MDSATTSLTIEQATQILDRSGRGRTVARELYRLLDGSASGLDIEGKMAVLALLEESFINRPGSVLEALERFA